jgi:transcriptional regulator with XRE-family HTH domain
MENSNQKIHLGKSIVIFRKLKGIKQETLALETGLSQSKISEIENSETVPDDILIKIAKAMNITPEILKEFNNEEAFYNIDNRLENVTINDAGQGIHQVFSPIEKVVELYERLLASEREKIEIIKKSKEI